MTKEERKELGYILGLIVECLNHVGSVPQDKLELLIDAVSEFEMTRAPKE